MVLKNYIALRSKNTHWNRMCSCPFSLFLSLFPHLFPITRHHPGHRCIIVVYNIIMQWKKGFTTLRYRLGELYFSHVTYVFFFSFLKFSITRLSFAIDMRQQDARNQDAAINILYVVHQYCYMRMYSSLQYFDNNLYEIDNGFSSVRIIYIFR